MLEHLSYSSLTTWSRCPKSFELSRIVKAEPIPAFYFAGGTAVHNATQDYDEGKTVRPWEEYFYPEVVEGSAREPNFSEWMMGGSKESPDDGDRWMEIGPLCIENWKKFSDSEFDVRTIELDVSTRLPGLPVKVKGFIDRVGLHEKHGQMIVDIKTGKNLPKDKGLQLGIYSALYEHKFGVRINKGAYFMAREGRLSRPYDLSKWSIEEVVRMFRATALEVSAGQFPAKQEYSCRFCDQRLNCFKVSGDTPRTEYYDSSHPRYTEEIPF